MKFKVQAVGMIEQSKSLIRAKTTYNVVAYHILGPKLALNFFFMQLHEFTLCGRIE